MSEKLQEAITLYKKGDKSKAMNLLIEIVNQEPNNSVAWYGLALCVDDLDKKIYCLKKVLSLDPSHNKASQVLEKLQLQKETSNNKKIVNDQPVLARKKTSLFIWLVLSLFGIAGAILVCVAGVFLTKATLNKPIATSILPTPIPQIPSIITGEPAEYIPTLPSKFEIGNSSEEINETLEDGTKLLSIAFTNKEATYNGDLVSFIYFVTIYPNESQSISQYHNVINSQTTLLEGVTYNDLFLDGTNESAMYMGKKNDIIEGLYPSRIKNAIILTVGYTPFNPDTITLEFIEGFMEGDLLTLHKLCVSKFFK